MWETITEYTSSFWTAVKDHPGVTIFILIALILILYSTRDKDKKKEKEGTKTKVAHGEHASDPHHAEAGGDAHKTDTAEHKKDPHAGGDGKEHHAKEPHFLVKMTAGTAAVILTIWAIGFFLVQGGCGSKTKEKQVVHNKFNPYVEYLHLDPGVESKTYYVNESLYSKILGDQIVAIHVTYPDETDTTYKDLSEKHRLPKGAIPPVHGTAMRWKCKDSATIKITWY